MRWTNEMREIIRDNYPQKTYKEIAALLGVTHKSIQRQLSDMGLAGLSKEERHKNKQDYKTIGSRRRANNKYNAILSRLNSTNRKRNIRYSGVKLKVSRGEFISWYMPKDFEGASVDRINKDGHYELANMQVILLAENIRKDKQKVINGECECFVCHKVKPLAEFAKDRRRHSGHSTICQDCDRQRYHKRKNKLLKKEENDRDYEC